MLPVSSQSARAASWLTKTALKGVPAKVLAHEPRPEQHRVERPVVDNDPDRLTGLAETDHHHAADRPRLTRTTDV